MAKNDEDESRETLEVERSELGKPSRREGFPLAAPREISKEDLRARQAAMGEHRRYDGPVFDEAEVLPAAFDPDADEEEVEATEVAPPPETEEEGGEHEE